MDEWIHEWMFQLNCNIDFHGQGSFSAYVVLGYSDARHEMLEVCPMASDMFRTVAVMDFHAAPVMSMDITETGSGRQVVVSGSSDGQVA
eukprot:scaffold230083_cov32-Prasinocladus_malaysianus.AAC.1